MEKRARLRQRIMHRLVQRVGLWAQVLGALTLYGYVSTKALMERCTLREPILWCIKMASQMYLVLMQHKPVPWEGLRRFLLRRPINRRTKILLRRIRKNLILQNQVQASKRKPQSNQIVTVTSMIRQIMTDIHNSKIRNMMIVTICLQRMPVKRLRL